MTFKQIFKFPEPLRRGIIKKRYQRFLSDIVLESGETVQAHVANSGSMRTCWQENCPVIVSDFSNQEKRKLKYTLQAVEMPDGWVGINTSNPNQAVKSVLAQGLIKSLKGYDFLLPEVKISKNSRIDLMLWTEELSEQARSFHPGKRTPQKLTPHTGDGNLNKELCFVEIKNVTLLENDGLISFPDAITTRGQKHLLELIDLKKQGFRAIILFFVGRNSARCMTTAKDIDPKYDRFLKEAIYEHGVEALAIKAITREDGLYFDSEIEIRL